MRPSTLALIEAIQRAISLDRGLGKRGDDHDHAADDDGDRAGDPGLRETANAPSGDGNAEPELKEVHDASPVVAHQRGR